MKRFYILTLLLLVQATAFSQVLTIEIPEHRFRIDPYNNIVVIQRESLAEYSNLAEYEGIDLALNNFDFQFNSVPANLEFTGSYSINNGTDDYSLFFTQLPLLKIQTSTHIPGTGGGMNAEFSYADFDQIMVEQIILKNHNSYLANNPKKSYTLEFWTETESHIPIDVEFET